MKEVAITLREVFEYEHEYPGLLELDGVFQQFVKDKLTQAGFDLTGQIQRFDDSDVIIFRQIEPDAVEKIIDA